MLCKVASGVAALGKFCGVGRPDLSADLQNGTRSDTIPTGWRKAAVQSNWFLALQLPRRDSCSFSGSEPR